MDPTRKILPAIVGANAFQFTPAGCNTIEGVGKDIRKGGEAIAGAADKAKS